MGIATQTKLPPRRSDISPYRWRLSVFHGPGNLPLFSESGFFTADQALRHATIMLARFNDVTYFMVEVSREEAPDAEAQAKTD